MTRIIDQWDRGDISFYIVKEPSVGFKLNAINSEEIKKCIKGYLRGTYSPDLFPAEKALIRTLIEDLPARFECYVGLVSSRAMQTANVLLKDLSSLRGYPWTDGALDIANYADVSDEYIENWANFLIEHRTINSNCFAIDIDEKKEILATYQKTKRLWIIRKKAIGPVENYTILGKYQDTPAAGKDFFAATCFLQKFIRWQHIHPSIIIARDEICRFILAYLSGVNSVEDIVMSEYRVNNNELVKVNIQSEGGVQVEMVTRERWKREKANGIVLKALPV